MAPPITVAINMLVFIRNLLVHLAEKILLMQPLTFGGDYPDYWRHVLQIMALSLGFRSRPKPVVRR